MLSENIRLAAEKIKNADALLITAGAGLGIDSGLPDFRGDKGFWKAYPPIEKLGISFIEMANPGWFDHRPELAWAFYGHRLNLYRKTTPHKGFKQLLEIGQSKPCGYFVFTSNVDGQFQKAGYDENRIEECHGSIHHFQCTEPCNREIWDASELKVIVDEENFEAQEPLPLCPNCSRLARPNVLMFGDWHWIPDRSDMQHNRFINWLQKIMKNNLRLAVIEIGAGENVATVRYTSEKIVFQYNGTLIRINPRDFEVPCGHISIPCGGAEGIHAIYEIIVD